MTINELISNIKRGKCIPYKRETLTLIINILEACKKYEKHIIKCVPNLNEIGVIK